MNIYVAITTYNREESYRKLLKDIEKTKGHHSLFIAIYDDCSDKEYVNKEDGNFVYRFEENQGKTGHWKVIDRVLYDASFHEFDYFFLLQDDCELVDGFFDKAIDEWEGIEDENKATMCTFTPNTVYSRAIWGNKSVNVRYNKRTFLRTNYIDLIFMCPIETLRTLSFTINEIPNRNVDSVYRSSGVGRQLTGRLKLLGKTMYGAYDSLITHGKEESKMNKEERERNPLHTLVRGIGTEVPIIVGVCSIPEREISLYKMLLTISPQVDTVYVTLNGYTKVPEYSEEFSNVVFELDSNERGDANKFKHIKECRGYFFSCDDDIIYPPDYIYATIRKIQSNPNTIYTYHGRNVKRYSNLSDYKPITDFYKDTEQVHYLLEVKEDVRGDIPGTGVCGFDTRYIDINMDIFKQPNMSDIYLGIYAKENNIPIIIINHKRGWLTTTGMLFQEESIYNSNKDNNERQCTLVNATVWK